MLIYRHPGRVAIVLACTLLLSACVSSAGGGDGECGEVDGCGGDLVGTWRLESVCVETPPPQEGLPPACNDLVRGAHAQPDAVYTFDGQWYTIDGTITLELNFAYTPACMEALAGRQLTPSECRDLGPELEAETADEADCVFIGGNCECTAFVVGDAPIGPQSYRTEGETLVDVTDDSRSPYCVDRDTLTVGHGDTSEVGGRQVFRRL